MRFSSMMSMERSDDVIGEDYMAPKSCASLTHAQLLRNYNRLRAGSFPVIVTADLSGSGRLSGCEPWSNRAANVSARQVTIVSRPLTTSAASGRASVTRARPACRARSAARLVGADMVTSIGQPARTVFSTSS